MAGTATKHATLLARRAFRGVALAVFLAVTVPGHFALAQQVPTKAEVDAATKRLFQAISVRDLEKVRLALNAGADVQAENADGLTPADVAIDNGYFDIAHMILAARNSREEEAADEAAARSAGPDPNAPPVLPPPPELLPVRPATRDADQAGGQTGDASTPAQLASTTTEGGAQNPPPAGGTANVSSGWSRPAAPAWPDSKPNPFDPKAQPSTGLPTLGSDGEVRYTGPRPAPAAAAPDRKTVGPSKAETYGPSQVPPAPTPREASGSTTDTLIGELVQVFGSDKEREKLTKQEERAEEARAALAPIEPEQGPAAPPKPKPKLLRNVTFVVGSSEILGRPLNVENVTPESCYNKDNGKSYFCVENLNWPDRIARRFDVLSRLYNGRKAIVRYDRGMATRAYVVFPSKNFADVAAYFQKLYGPPTGQAERYRSLLRTGRKPNIVLTWETVRTGADPATVLEVRKFDDVRSRRADTSIGIVRLFEKGSEPIFDAVSDRVFLVRRTSSDYQRSPEPDVR